MLLSAGADPNSLYFEKHIWLDETTTIISASVHCSWHSIHVWKHVYVHEARTLDPRTGEDRGLYEPVPKHTANVRRFSQPLQEYCTFYWSFGGPLLKRTSRVYYKNLFANLPHRTKMSSMKVFDYWSFVRFTKNKPKKLTHLCRQVIRTRLRQAKSLHAIDSLPLPANLKEYVKLNYFWTPLCTPDCVCICVWIHWK